MTVVLQILDFLANLKHKTYKASQSQICFLKANLYSQMRKYVSVIPFLINTHKIIGNQIRLFFTLLLIDTEEIFFDIFFDKKNVRLSHENTLGAV